ncbi:hypothetical protein [Robertmurraya andreesenii]|uniref:Transposase n=1 Tax=Anoxybacillus andreesenii TaxID=1325932 RepID=A0ABT9VB24_9BACL|nr:hypothetical protein [Robertmurraya andreesenii]
MEIYKFGKEIGKKVTKFNSDFVMFGVKMRNTQKSNQGMLFFGEKMNGMQQKQLQD